MPRPLPLLLLALLSGTVAALIGVAPAALPAELPAWAAALLHGAGGGWLPRSASAIGGGLAVFVVLALLVPGLADAIALGGLQRRLRGLALRRKMGEELAPDELRSAFSRTPLAAEGLSYAASLWRGLAAGDEARPFWRSPFDPDPVFRSAARMRLQASQLAGHLGLVIAAAGTILLLAAPRLAATDPAAAPRPALPWLLLAAGTALFILAGCIGIARLRLVGDILALVRLLFPVTPAELLSQGLARTARSLNGSFDAAGEAMKSALAVATDDLRTTLGSHDRRIAASVGTAVQRAVQPVAASLVETAERIETRDGEATERLLSGVLSSFLGDFQERFGEQAAALGDILARTRALADDLHGALGETETRLRDGAAALGERMLDGVGDAMGTAIAAQTESLQGMLQRVDAAVAAMEAGIERLGLRADTALESWSARTSELGSTLVKRGSEELQQTAASFGQLHTILETLSISVLPAINRLIGTQERLHAAIEADRQTSQSMSAAATDLGEAVRIAHEMVERQMLLTRELAQLPRQRGDIGDLRAAAPDALAQAIEDLRSEADRDRDALPRL